MTRDSDWELDSAERELRLAECAVRGKPTEASVARFALAKERVAELRRAMDVIEVTEHA